MGKIDFNTIKNEFENVGYDVTSYSGRGMYGRKCLGVSCDSPENAIIEAIVSFADIAEDVNEMKTFASALLNAQTDSLGLSMIIYWPAIVWEGEDWNCSDDGDED